VVRQNVTHNEWGFHPVQAFSAGGFSDFSVLQRRLFQTRESCEGTKV
jgi:hypothetical protein